MRIARKLTLLAMLALAATALAAPFASAQTEPELHNQTPRIVAAQEVHAADDVACPAVAPSPPPDLSPTSTSGGCRLHITTGSGEAVLSSHLTAGGTEVIVSSCHVEADVRIDSAGEGWIVHQEYTGPAPPCIRRACGQPNPPMGEGRAHTFYLREIEVPGQGPREEAVLLFCTQPLSQETTSHCEVTRTATQPTTHRYRFVATDASGHGTVYPRCEISGTLDVEAVLGTSGEAQTEQSIEVRHT